MYKLDAVSRNQTRYVPKAEVKMLALRTLLAHICPTYITPDNHCNETEHHTSAERYFTVKIKATPHSLSIIKQLITS